MRGRWAILAAVAAALVGVAGCGGTEHARVNPEAMLEAAAAHPVETAEVEIELRLRVEGVPQLSEPIAVRLDGPYRSKGPDTIPSFDWRLSATALGFPVDGRLVSADGNLYLSVYRNGYELGEQAVAEANRRLIAAGGLPRVIRDWLGPARITGEDSAGGVDCERISAPLRGERPSRELAPVAAALGISAPRVTGHATACVGFEDRVLHELELSLGLTPAPEDAARLGGATRILVDAVVVNSDVGERQEIATPGGRFRPIRDLLLSLRDFGLPVPVG